MTESNTYEIDTKSTGFEDIVEENVCENECLPLRIKLVDCSKYPWYYKKYSQQILEKVNSSVSISDSDSEIDIEHVDDLNDDCFIIDDILEESNNQNNKDSVPSLSSVTLNPTAKKKHREDIEIQKALSQKHTEIIDFKRNKGLIGMKITQIYIKETNLAKAEPNLNETTVSTTVNTEIENDEIIAKSNVIASNKALSSIGTIRITPTLPKVSTALNETEAKNNEPIEHQESSLDVLIKKIPVILEKQSRKSCSYDCLDCLCTKKQDSKCQDKFLDNKNSKDLNEKESNFNFSALFNPLSLQSKVRNYSRTVKNIRDTTIYKKKILKDFGNKLLELLILKSKNKETLPNEANNVNINANEDNLITRIEKKDELSYPILPRGKLVKNNKNVNESIKPRQDKPYIFKENKSTSHSDGMHQAANKPMSGNYNYYGNIQRTPLKNTVGSKKLNSKVKDIDERVETTKTVKKKPVQYDFPIKRKADIQFSSSSHINSSLTQSSCPMNAKIYNNLPINPTVSSDLTQFYFTHPTNKTSHVSNSNGINYSKNIISDNIVLGSNEVTYNQGNDIGSTADNITTPLSTATALSTQCKPPSTPINYDEFITTNNSTKKRDCNNKTILSHLDNARNTYPSAIILKPSKPKSIPCRSPFDHPILDTHGPPQICVRMQPRFYYNPYKPNYYRTPYNRDQRFVPEMPNCTMTNYYRFPTPYFNTCNSQYNTQQFRSSHVGRHMPNNFQKWNPRNECPRNAFPPRLPMSTLQANANPIIKTKPGFVTQQDKVAKTMINTQQDRSSTVPNANEVTAEIESQLPRHKVHSYKENINKLNTHSVISEENDNSITNKMIRNKDDNDIEKQLECMFKIPEISSKPEITITNSFREDINQQNGYSPPILPIPTFERVLDRVQINVQNQNQHNAEAISHVDVSKQIKYVKQSNKRAISYQSQKIVGKRDSKTNKDITYTNDFYNRIASCKSKESIRKQSIKKISLEEYKKRTLSYRFGDSTNSQNDNSVSNKKRRIIYNQPKNREDKQSAESDHGYDSDSTVILV